MTYNRPRRAARGAFTLTEILVVMLILVILVSLTAAGVLKIMGQGPQLRTANDIRQFDVAFQQLFNEYPSINYVPSYLILREDNAYNLANPAEAKSVAFLRRMFGKNLNLTPVAAGGPGIDWNGNLVIDPSGPNGMILEGEHCLVFFLGGIPAAPGGPPGCLGFSTNPTNPATPGGTRRGPFFQNWEAKRLFQDPTNGFYVYLDAWPAALNRPAKPYAFFSAYGVQNGYKNAWSGGSDCLSLGLLPYVAANGTYANPNTFQIVSAGKDGQFGKGGMWNPLGGGTLPTPNPADSDNQTNFTKGILEAGQ